MLVAEMLQCVFCLFLEILIDEIAFPGTLGLIIVLVLVRCFRYPEQGNNSVFVGT